ncbi:hypothetical protein L596_030268 [Steinernema carpocapsae]|uniref:Uncharacterized protein n=1 Tax=Steinernema carpocapsae TaxID=34508 RepID=A0A4U5LNY8_STECR|nr:hypothetical protein L596_030268 [Steinernema carpocapsae]
MSTGTGDDNIAAVELPDTDTEIVLILPTQAEIDAVGREGELLKPLPANEDLIKAAKATLFSRSAWKSRIRQEEVEEWADWLHKHFEEHGSKHAELVQKFSEMEIAVVFTLYEALGLSALTDKLDLEKMKRAKAKKDSEAFVARLSAQRKRQHEILNSLIFLGNFGKNLEKMVDARKAEQTTVVLKALKPVLEEVKMQKAFPKVKGDRSLDEVMDEFVPAPPVVPKDSAETLSERIAALDLDLSDMAPGASSGEPTSTAELYFNLNLIGDVELLEQRFDETLGLSISNEERERSKKTKEKLQSVFEQVIKNLDNMKIDMKNCEGWIVDLVLEALRDAEDEESDGEYVEFYPSEDEEEYHVARPTLNEHRRRSVERDIARLGAEKRVIKIESVNPDEAPVVQSAPLVAVWPQEPQPGPSQASNQPTLHPGLSAVAQTFPPARNVPKLTAARPRTRVVKVVEPQNAPGPSYNPSGPPIPRIPVRRDLTPPPTIRREATPPLKRARSPAQIVHEEDDAFGAALTRKVPVRRETTPPPVKDAFKASEARKMPVKRYMTFTGPSEKPRKETTPVREPTPVRDSPEEVPEADDAPEASEKAQKKKPGRPRMDPAYRTKPKGKRGRKKAAEAMGVDTESQEDEVIIKREPGDVIDFEPFVDPSLRHPNTATPPLPRAERQPDVTIGDMSDETFIVSKLTKTKVKVTGNGEDQKEELVERPEKLDRIRFFRVTDPNYISRIEKEHHGKQPQIPLSVPLMVEPPKGALKYQRNEPKKGKKGPPARLLKCPSSDEPFPAVIKEKLSLLMSPLLEAEMQKTLKLFLSKDSTKYTENRTVLIGDDIIARLNPRVFFCSLPNASVKYAHVVKACGTTRALNVLTHLTEHFDRLQKTNEFRSLIVNRIVWIFSFEYFHRSTHGHKFLEEYTASVKQLNYLFGHRYRPEVQREILGQGFKVARAPRTILIGPTPTAVRIILVTVPEYGSFAPKFRKLNIKIRELVEEMNHNKTMDTDPVFELADWAAASRGLETVRERLMCLLDVLNTFAICHPPILPEGCM